MKTKPISLRFEENDLNLAKSLSGITKTQKLVDLLIAEYVKPLKGSMIELPKDYMNIKSIGVIKNDGTVEQLITTDKPKSVKLTITPKHSGETIPPIPVKETGEDSFDFAARKNEWKRKYNQ